MSRREQRVGGRIFHRTARSITLTDEGRWFHDEVAPSLARIEDAAIRAAGSSAEVRDRMGDLAADGFDVAVRFGPVIRDGVDLLYVGKIEFVLS